MEKGEGGKEDNSHEKEKPVADFGLRQATMADLDTAQPSAHNRPQITGAS